jgi:hypothetical protein
MHALHFDRRRLQRTVWMTLVAWLFALTAGVVNACALTPQRDGLRAVVLKANAENRVRHETAATSTRAGDHGPLVHEGPVAHAGHEQEAAKGGCIKFCDDESSALAKYNSPNVDLGASVIAVFEPWRAIVSSTSVETRRAIERFPVHGPPLVIRFLRLTL